MHRRLFLKQAAFFFAIAKMPLAFAGTSNHDKDPENSFDFHIKDRLPPGKRLFNKSYKEDIVLEKRFLPILETSLSRLKRVQKIVGYGNFCLLGFDDAIRVGKSYSQVGAFTKSELDFLAMIFYSNVKTYGFLGDKPIKNISEKINKKEVKKIAHTGNYLYHGKPVAMYDKIKTQLGSDVVLTSGVRGIMKQFLLFLNKAQHCRGNLSMASRSLAPPGYSFHGIGDFDVGKKGYGVHNFTKEFTRTKVYKKLSDFGFIKFRYEQNNNLGVRFEPWHIEVV